MIDTALHKLMCGAPMSTPLTLLPVHAGISWWITRWTTVRASYVRRTRKRRAKEACDDPSGIADPLACWRYRRHQRAFWAGGPRRRAAAFDRPGRFRLPGFG